MTLKKSQDWTDTLVEGPMEMGSFRDRGAQLLHAWCDHLRDQSQISVSAGYAIDPPNDENGARIGVIGVQFEDSKLIGFTRAEMEEFVVFLRNLPKRGVYALMEKEMGGFIEMLEESVEEARQFEVVVN